MSLKLSSVFVLRLFVNYTIYFEVVVLKERYLMKVGTFKNLTLTLGSLIQT